MKPNGPGGEERWGGGGVVTSTSIDDANVRLTIAATMQTEPEWQGLRKCTLSTLAVTQGPPATDFAANPAQTSIQLKTCSVTPAYMYISSATQTFIPEELLLKALHLLAFQGSTAVDIVCNTKRHQLVALYYEEFTSTHALPNRYGRSPSKSKDMKSFWRSLGVYWLVRLGSTWIGPTGLRCES